MIKIENEEVYGCETAIRGMRNPMNSWDKSDSFYGCRDGDYGRTEANECNKICRGDCSYCIGLNDLTLMKTLVAAGTDHSKFMRMVSVTCDITAPLYWWKEFDTYKVGTVRNSCSTMHKIHEKEFTLDDFSHEHLGVDYLNEGDVAHNNLWFFHMVKIIEALNIARDYYNRESHSELKKKYWWQMIQLLPSSYNQRATVQMNYQVLRNMYHARKNHKLDEWRDFCKWIESLPYSELITGGKEK